MVLTQEFKKVLRFGFILVFTCIPLCTVLLYYVLLTVCVFVCSCQPLILDVEGELST